jgi:hypothetical protein
MEQVYIKIHSNVNDFYFTVHIFRLKEETQNLPTEMFPSCLFVIHDSTARCQDDITKTIEETSYIH